MVHHILYLVGASLRSAAKTCTLPGAEAAGKPFEGSED